MKIVADENMPLVQEFFAGLGEVVTLPGRTLRAADVRDADVLLVRSVTTVNAGLLQDSRVRFLGTATIGTDHLDLPWLESAGITVASAPGCNARAVAEYVVAALVELGEAWRPGATLGVVGLGNVGRQVARLGAALGLRVIASDPFPASAEVPLLELSALVGEADILCLHTPLTRGGPHPTHHLFNADTLQKVKSGAVLLNAGRGGVIDNDALRERLRTHAGALRAVLDVWEGEPAIATELLAEVELGTPHIAGYSQDGKWRGTEQVYRALCTFLGRPAPHRYTDFVLSTAEADIVIAPEASPEQAVAKAVRIAYAIIEDDVALRAAQQGADPAAAFDQLRKHYRVRREFPAHRVCLPAGHAAAPVLAALGFELREIR